MPVTYYARKKDDGKTIRYQTIIDHLTKTSELAKNYTASFTEANIGKTLGLLHDTGKYSDAFQQRLNNPAIRTDHSTAGAQIAADMAKTQPFPDNIAYHLLSYAIAGHHGSGIPNWINRRNNNKNDLCTRLENSDRELYKAWKTELTSPLPSLASCLTPEKIAAATYEEVGFSLFLYTRFLHSCLIDADRTEAATAFGDQLPPSHYPSMGEMSHQLNDYIKQKYPVSTQELNQIRTSVRTQCIWASANNPGIFTLTVPTGGGKTISSLAFALNHAKHHTHFERIIYTIPFTSII